MYICNIYNYNSSGIKMTLCSCCFDSLNDAFKWGSTYKDYSYEIFDNEGNEYRLNNLTEKDFYIKLDN